MENEQSKTVNKKIGISKKAQKGDLWRRDSSSDQEVNKAVGGRVASKRVSLFIGGMTSCTDLSALQRHLRLLAGTNSGLFVSMVSRIKRKTFSGYGIIKNVDASAADVLLQIKNFKFQDCWYGIKPFLKKKSDISKLKSERAHKKVFLSGITPDLVEDDLEVYFRKYGEVLHVQISKQPGSNEYKGFGFVEFDSSHSAQSILTLQSLSIKGVTVFCHHASFSSKPKEPGVRSTSSSQGQTNSLFPKDIMEYNLTKPGLKAVLSANSPLPNLTLMSPRIAENHTFANVAFRIRLNP